MREIFFKAKRIDNGEWVEGYYQKRYYFLGNEEHLIFHADSYKVWEYAEIDPKTLCQFTGLYDKNRNRIWENDILRCKKRGADIKFTVVWSKHYADWRVRDEWGLIPICIEEDGNPVSGRDYEVIGNIFEGGFENGEGTEEN